jgi:hypothetical protein
VQERTRGERLQKLRQRVFAMYGDECWLCGGGEADTIDHLLPLSEGGDDSIDNLRPAHGRKSESCPGNYSRRRSQAPIRKSVPQPIIDVADGITYGDGWIAKKRGSMTSTMYYSIAGMQLDDPFVQRWISE